MHSCSTHARTHELAERSTQQATSEAYRAQRRKQAWTAQTYSGNKPALRLQAAEAWRISRSPGRGRWR
jgi:hypothetical protein